MDRKIHKLIIKLWEGQCTKQELQFLSSYFNDPEFEEIDNDLEEELFSYEEGEFDQNIKKSIFQRIESNLGPTSSQTRGSSHIVSFKLLKYAAVFIGLLVSGYFIFNSQSQKGRISSGITIKLNDGTVKEIKGQEMINLGGGEKITIQKGNKLVYRSTKLPQKLEYNTLIVPNGRKMEVELSDGTLVHLNSGTSFKYPVNFLPSKPREVYIQGEAYFKVFHDPKHKFIVHANGFQTEVLGTKFNVDSYKGSSASKITLLKGSVRVSISDQSSQILEPDQMAIINNSDNKMEVQQVIGNNSIAWIDGYLLFQNERFGEIIPELERQYDVVIHNQNQDLAKKRFRGKFKDENLEDILKTFSSASHFKFEKNKDQIFIYDNNQKPIHNE